MWGPKYWQRQYLEGRQSVPVVVRRSYGPAREDSNPCRSTYGVWNDSYGVNCGLWDDVLFQYSRNCRNESKRRRNVSLAISKVSTPSQNVRCEALATPKITGCGPNCKKPRCAATDPPYDHAKPPGAADKRRVKKRRAGASGSSPFVKKYTYSTMAHVQDKVVDLGIYDMTMGLKNMKKVEEQEVVEFIPISERNCGECSQAPQESMEEEVEVLPTCARNCGECLKAPQESMEEEVEMKRTGNQGSGLKSLARTRTVGSNTEEVSQAAEVPVRVLQDVNNNTVLDWSEKTPPVVLRLKIPTPIPRVAFLRPPKPRLKDIIEYEGNQLPTPRFSTPRTPRPTWSSSPISLTSRRVPPSRIPPQAQKLMPGKLAPRLFTSPATIHLSRTENLSPPSPIPLEPEKPQHKPEPPQVQPVAPQVQPVAPPLQPVAPPLQPVAPPLQPVAPPLQPVAPSLQPAAPPLQPVAPPLQPVAHPLQPVAHPLQPFTPTPQQSSKHSSKLSSKQSSKQSSEQSSKESSEQFSEQYSTKPSKQFFEHSSKGSSKQSSEPDSLDTSISDFENSSCSTEGPSNDSIPEAHTPMFCQCSLCGKCESINDGSQDNSIAVYRNNVLCSPGRALTVQNSNITSSRWRFLYTFLEIIFLVVLAGVLTVGMIPYIETVFRAYVADYCSRKKEWRSSGDSGWNAEWGCEMG